LLRDAAGFIYVEDLDNPEPSPEDARHLLSVLRLRQGEVVVASDGNGAYVACEVAAQPSSRGRSRAVDVEVLATTDEIVRTDSPEESCCVAFVMPKGDRADWTVQKLTELGVDAIVPLMSDRSVVRLDSAECKKRGERFRRIAKEAGAQSRRTRLPVMPDPMTFADYLASCATGLESLAIAEPGGAGIETTTRSILVGPEGGWSQAELDAVPFRIGMGETILRAETAAIVAGTLLVARSWERSG
jgi:16S rRNA (uracil1498-N3)-methyltransferase